MALKRSSPFSISFQTSRNKRLRMDADPMPGPSGFQPKRRAGIKMEPQKLNQRGRGPRPQQRNWRQSDQGNDSGTFQPDDPGVQTGNFQRNAQDGNDQNGNRNGRGQGPNRPNNKNRPRNRNNEFNNRDNGPRRNLDHNDNDSEMTKKSRGMGFLELERIAKLESNDIIAKINERKDAFLELIRSPISRPDIYSLILQIIAKISTSSFVSVKVKLLTELEVCDQKFLLSLQTYLIELPYVENKKNNNMYWSNQLQFWTNFLVFSETIIDISPSTAVLKCRTLIESTSQCCLDLLSSKHNFNLPQEYSLKLAQIRERLNNRDQDEKVAKQPPKLFHGDTVPPPENFRDLNVVPTKDDLMDKRPYLRGNVVTGGYTDLEHYLDVQFRLLREDCYGPLRDGIFQYMNDPNKRKYDSIRVHKNVKFLHPFVTPQKFGQLIQIQTNNNKRARKINWAHSKRFIFGSLLLFTKDNCKSFLVATIMERDLKLLEKGQIPVSVVGQPDHNLYNDDLYTMIESEVYFEPYSHILKALQDPNFPAHVAMDKYIVKVEPEPRPPSYLTPEMEYLVPIVDELIKEKKFKVLDITTWPNNDELGLNTTQFEAYHTALTHEFAVIQGPPGTGKTYLGVKVAKTLIDNLNTSEKHSKCLMLVICYTNHALDQFLEALLPVTESIVRVGGQSRNEIMEKYNLNELRKTKNAYSHFNKLYQKYRYELKNAIRDLQTAQEQLESLTNGVLSIGNFKDQVADLDVLKKSYRSDPIKRWLFEHRDYFDFETILAEYAEDIDHQMQEDVDNERGRDDLVLDEFNMEDMGDIIFESTMSFSLNKAETEIRRLLSFYMNSNNHRERQNLQAEIVNLKSHIEHFKSMLQYQNMEVNLKLGEVNPSDIPMPERWAIYFQWAKILIDEKKVKVKPLEDALKVANTTYEEARMLLDLETLTGVKVVGMTTSGAARLRKLLQELAPPIVIVEEAAEVLEAHIVTSLNKMCKHLILIGDHQQLRPSAACMKLARDFNIEVSLFERMIMNNIHSETLGVQHRMRPEIASLIVPHIYKHLANHPSVEGFPKVKGITSNLFFFTHNYKEEEVDDGSSKTNPQEGDMALRLANYLMQQGYKPEDITVLSAYSGHMFYMRKHRDMYRHLAKVKITVVDNYQGEEAKVIILSLVRNNNQGRIGFLGVKNRICVALSRAKEGFYILGNIDILKKNSDLWKDIAVTLEKNGSLGSSLRLECQVHSEITTVSCPSDFDKTPEGGCLKECGSKLKCGHQCILICHAYDLEHKEYKCLKNCEEKCERDHKCPKKCFEKCPPCKQLVTKTLPCGHDMAVYCHLDPESPVIKCTTVVKVTLPKCGHEVKKQCHEPVDKVVCPVPCRVRVAGCGHQCRRKCHVTDDPDHEKYLCQKPCLKPKNGCTADQQNGELEEHQCKKMCYETCDNCDVLVIKLRSNCKHRLKVVCSDDVDRIPCKEKCARMLPCKHQCRLKCYEPCGGCRVMVNKNITECGHEIRVECKIIPTRMECKSEICIQKLSCGHPCKSRCNQVCDDSKCKVLVDKEFASPCGHKVKLPCNVFKKYAQMQPPPAVLLEHCQTPCHVDLACKHVCMGTCGECHQGRLHKVCTQKCNQLNVCGHPCIEPCNEVCPPCRRRCFVKCSHSECGKSCGAPCTPCREKCDRKCIHGECKKLCGQPCDRPPCDEPCTLSLACGHPCRGLCGEPCPDACKICRPNTFPTDFGYPFDDDDRLIKLQDCTHVQGVESMDGWVNATKESENNDNKEIKIPTCPDCRAPIINTYRYKDVINEKLRKDINPIKLKAFGTEKEIKKEREELLTQIVVCREHHNTIYNMNEHWKSAFTLLRIYVKTHKKMSLVDTEMLQSYLEILDMAADCYSKHEKYTELKEEVNNQIKIICKSLSSNVKKISTQQRKDIESELKRLSKIIQLSKIFSNPTFKSSQNVTSISESAQKAREAILSWKKFDEAVAVLALEKLQADIKVYNIIVTDEERNMVVRAMSREVKTGAWFKCPNGHAYCIANCGGAVTASVCPECKERIGGTGYRLAPGNQLAPEMQAASREDLPWYT